MHAYIHTSIHKYIHVHVKNPCISCEFDNLQIIFLISLKFSKKTKGLLSRTASYCF